MNYIDLNGEMVTPKTESMAYIQTNHRISTLEEKHETDMANTRQTISETAGVIGTQISNEINTVNSRITSEISTVNNRFDNIIAHNNDTDGNSELIDIRTGANGTVYQSAGTAMREQIIQLHNTQNKLISGQGTADEFLDSQIRSHNLCNKQLNTVGYYLTNQGEPIQMNSEYGYSNYIPVVGGKSYIAYHPWNCNEPVFIYDANKSLIRTLYYDSVTPLSGTSHTINNVFWYTFSIPMNGAYIRLNLSLTSDIFTMVVAGDTAENIPESYVPFAEELHAGKFAAYLNTHYSNDENSRQINFLTETVGHYINDENNTVIGYNALSSGEGISCNVAIGSNTMANIVADSTIDNQSGRYNVAVGQNTCQNMTTGNHNTACGYQSMRAVTTGSYNTALGEDSLMTIGAGHSNVAVGCRALQSATEGNNNTAIGQASCYWDDTKHPTGSNNTSIGAHSGCSDGNGSNNIAVGYFAKANQGLNDTIVVGNNIAAQRDGEMILGHSNTSSVILVCNGQKKVLRFADDGRVLWENYIVP